MGTVRFGNNQIEKIMGYRDYQMENVMISRVYYMEGLGHNLFYVGQLCDSDHKVMFRKHTCFIRDLEGVDLLSFKEKVLAMASKKDHLCSACALEKKARKVPTNLKIKTPFKKALSVKFVNQTLKAYYEDVGISHQTSVARTPQRNEVIKRRNQTLVEAARTMLIFSKALIFLCEDLGKLKPKEDIRIFIGYALAKMAYRIYNKRNCLIIEIIHVDFDEMTAIASEQFSSGPGLLFLTHGTINLGLVPNFPSPTPYVSPTKNDWDLLFQPMFDEYFSPSPSVASLVLTVVASVPADPTGTPSSTSIDQDAPSPIWELVSRPDCVMIIALKWIFKVKLGEMRGVLKNKA
nr:hypothetical protein [Tanacetum cinerariifolium]